MGPRGVGRGWRSRDRRGRGGMAYAAFLLREEIGAQGRGGLWVVRE